MFATRPVPEESRSKRQGAPGEQPLVLVVEDSPADAQLVELELRRAAPELSCRFATSVQEAKAAGKASRFEAILLDLKLPDSQGLETLAQIRDEFGDTPVVVLTGQVDMKLAIASLRSGARDYLPKHDIAQLEPTLRRVLAEAAAERERREHELDLLHTLKLESVERLAAGLAHEINSPIQFVGDNLVFLRKAFQLMLPALSAPASGEGTGDGADTEARYRGRSPESAKLRYALEQVPAAIEQALAGVSRVARLVATMKDHLGPPRGIYTRVDLRGVLEASIWRCRDHWQPVAEVTTEYEPDLPELRGYPEELGEAFVNVIINSSEAIRRRAPHGKGTIAIRTRRVGANVEVRIGDDGAGVAQKDIAKVFDPFFTTKAVGQGTGQGLSVVHAIVVNKHGGTVSVESELGHGATFIVSLPLSMPNVPKD